MAPINKGDSGDVYALLIGVALVCLIVALMIALLLRLADAMAPQVGDIISFSHMGRTGPVVQGQIAVRRTDRASAVGCTLDDRIMRASGGSIVIEALQVRPKRIYRVHWAGTHTSRGSADCGAAADLMLNHVDMVALMYAAGGLATATADARRFVSWRFVTSASH